jgi:hypothetical protein
LTGAGEANFFSQKIQSSNFVLQRQRFSESEGWMRFKRNKSLVVLLVFLAACQATDQPALQRQLETAVTRVQNALVPDQRLDILEAQVRFENETWLLSGETTLPDAKAALVKAVDSRCRQATPSRYDAVAKPDFGRSTQAVVRECG